MPNIITNILPSSKHICYKGRGTDIKTKEEITLLNEILKIPPKNKNIFNRSRLNFLPNILSQQTAKE